MTSMQAAIERARAAWPALPVPTEAFTAHLRARMPDPDRPHPSSIDAMCVDDLWLACACVLAVPGAAEAFRERHLGDIRRGLGPELGAEDDRVHDLLHELLAGRPPQQPARLLAYGGHGRLGRWVNVVARRRRVDVLRARPRHAPDPALQAVAAAYGDPELAVVQGTMHRAFRGVLERAAAALEPRERNILRYVYVHRLRVDEIAGMYRVSRSTMKRRLAALRERLAADVREGLGRELGLDRPQIERELADLDSALHVTLSRIFDRAAGQPR